ncbi:hypothetical protein [Brasilonema sp. UFV-L1]|uniref:hypothetical protein n=1 Tax=Brasilonema sp. UFV-L1 TaxID=2234130 RepID=UPI00145F6710|nr:hypothetical protein [Brasilonema sp. UFV-L1]
MELYIYPGCTSQVCQFCQSQSIPRTFLRGKPVCLKCTELKGLNPIPFSTRSRRQANTLTELPLSKQEEAAIISLLRIPQTTSEIASHIAMSRSTTLKKLTYLEARKKVFRFGTGAGKPCWWALSLEAAVPNMIDKSFPEQFLELVRLGELSVLELKLKLGKRIEDILSVGRRLQKAGKVCSYLKDDIQYFKAV